MTKIKLKKLDFEKAFGKAKITSFDKEDEYVCHTCGRVFNSYDALHRHKQKGHGTTSLVSRNGRWIVPRLPKYKW